jgi:hypothetical protein
LHYHGDEEQDISGEEEENVEEAEVWNLVILPGIRINVLSIPAVTYTSC